MDKKELLEEVCMQFRIDVENWEIDEILKLLEYVPEEKLRAYEKLTKRGSNKMLVKNEDGKTVLRYDWGPSLISSGYSRPGPMNCRVISWDMERLQTSLLLRHRAPMRTRLVKLLRFGRI